MWGKGKIVADRSPEQVLAGMGVPPDFTAPPFIRWIHRSTGEAEIYFVASGAERATEALCAFRVTGRRPEFWQPETGKIEAAAAYEQSGGVTRIPMRFEPSGSVFVVFRKGAASFDPVVRVTLDGRQILPPPETKGDILIEKAVYGVPGDPKRTRDVRAKVQAIVDAGELSFRASRMAEGDDPALNVEKTLVVDYTVAGKRLKAGGRDPEIMTFESGPGARLVAGVHAGDGGLSVEAWEPGRYELTTAAGRKAGAQVPVPPSALEITGPWEVRFPPGGGAPERVIMEKLVSWSEHPDPGVRSFSGTAAFANKIRVPRAMVGDNQHAYLDLGKVQVMAQVKLNGRDLGILWKSPYVMDVTGVLKAGDNDLEIRVTDLWVNRLIGDEQLPEDSDRNADGTLKAWPQWVIDGKPSPTGRFTFTSWRLWKKSDRLVESGLVGPVTLRVSEEVSAR